MKILDLVQEIQRRLSYDPLTGKCYWVAVNKNHPRLTGQEAGSLRECERGNRYYIKVCGKAIPLARVAFVLMTGKFPEIADHINGDTTDNRWENLRDVGLSHNAWNLSLVRPSKKSKLPVGVTRLGNGFRARIAVNKETIYLGYFTSVKDAQEAYLEAKKKYHGEFARTA